MKSQRQSDIESAVWLLEHFVLEAGLSHERVKIRRAIEEAAALWSQSPEDYWWKWIVEASKSLSLKCKVIDGQFHEICEMLVNDARLVFRDHEKGKWFSVHQGRGRRFLLREGDDSTTADRRISRAELRDRLEAEAEGKMIRVVVFEPQLTGTLAGVSDRQDSSPLGRFLRLLIPDQNDVGVIVLFALLTGILALATPLAVETMVNIVAFGSVLQPVILLALTLFVFLGFSAALRALQTYIVEIIQRRQFARIAADLAYRLPRVNMSSLDGRSGRELVNRFFDFVTVQKVTSLLLLDGISLVLSTLIGMAVLAFYHPWLLGFDIILLAMIAFVIFVLGRGAIRTSIKESTQKYSTAAWLENLVNCPVTFHQGGAAEFALDRSDRHIFQYLEARRIHFRVLMRQIIFALGLQALASTMLLGLGGWLVMAGQLTLGQLVASELIVTVIVGSFAKMGKHMESFYDLMASMDKLGLLFDLPMEPQEGLLGFADEGPATVEIRRLSSRNAYGKMAVDHLDYDLKSGDRLAICGESGSGKSRLLDIFYATRSPETGYLTINQLDPRDLRPDALRRRVALVREVEIFDGTIAENIHLERPEVSMHDVREALIMVGLLKQVLEMPDGLDTQLVETGSPLSSTQMKKLTLARAIAGKPSLLLIDGLLDSIPDWEIDDIADRLFGPSTPWTMILVTGRESLLKRATKRLNLTRSHDEENEETEYAR